MGAWQRRARVLRSPRWRKLWGSTTSSTFPEAIPVIKKRKKNNISQERGVGVERANEGYIGRENARATKMYPRKKLCGSTTSFTFPEVYPITDVIE